MILDLNKKVSECIPEGYIHHPSATSSGITSNIRKNNDIYSFYSTNILEDSKLQNRYRFSFAVCFLDRSISIDNDTDGERTERLRVILLDFCKNIESKFFGGVATAQSVIDRHGTNDIKATALVTITIRV